MDRSKPTITIIGTGALGSTLQMFFEENGYLVRSAWNSRRGLIYSDSSEKFETVDRTLPESDSESGDLIFITTPDDLIKRTAQSLSNQPISWGKKIVVHCSGNLTSDELTSLSESGAKTVSMHPLQTFKRGDGSDRFNDITMSLQGDNDAKEKLKPIIQEMGAQSLNLNKKQKRYLHIAAVMASNYLVALMFSVENLLKDAELKEGFDALETLVNQTVTNIFEKGPADALTGPIARGDVESVQTHLSELSGIDQKNLYKILGLEALKIARQSGSVPEDTMNKLCRLFEEKNSNK
ncbi:MAG: DUF2520 domain-containing protein [Balneolaceae bacterium]|nr:DUF2520 domain-containing protein [Balneolaceae bacterium]